MKKDRLIRVDEDFAKWVDDMANEYAKNSNLPRKIIGSRFITKKIVEKYSNKKMVIEL